MLAKLRQLPFNSLGSMNGLLAKTAHSFRNLRVWEYKHTAC